MKMMFAKVANIHLLAIFVVFCVSFCHTKYASDCEGGSPQRCMKNCKVYFDGCNLCTKVNGNFACTRRYCHQMQQPRCMEKETDVAVRDCPYNCKVYFDGCNHCNCYKGKKQCTYWKCDTLKPPQCFEEYKEFEDGYEQKPFFALEETKKCKNNCKVHFDGCNYCSCVNGRMNCTRKTCFPTMKPLCLVNFLPHEADYSGRFSVEGCDKYSNGCHVCTRNDEGFKCEQKYGSIQCRLKKVEPYCMVPTPTLLRCPKNCTLMGDGCNTCRCFKGMISCTTKKCPNHRSRMECQYTAEDEVEVFDEEIFKTCKVYFDGCNTCKKIQGQFACTKKACPADAVKKPKCLEHETETDKNELEPTELVSSTDKTETTQKMFCPKNCMVFFDGCNTCHCESGVCSKKACPVDSMKPAMCLTPYS